MPDHATPHPRAREDDLLSEPLGDELLIFDTTTGRAHSINATAAAVWTAYAKLLHDYMPSAARVSRRTAIRRLALAGASLGVALPVIRSIVAPSAAMAGSTADSPCSSQSDCTGFSSYRGSTSSCRPGEASAHGMDANCSTGSPGDPCAFGHSCIAGSCN